MPLPRNRAAGPQVKNKTTSGYSVDDVRHVKNRTMRSMFLRVWWQCCSFLKSYDSLILQRHSIPDGTVSQSLLLSPFLHLPVFPQERANLDPFCNHGPTGPSALVCPNPQAHPRCTQLSVSNSSSWTTVPRAANTTVWGEFYSEGKPCRAHDGKSAMKYQLDTHPRE